MNIKSSYKYSYLALVFALIALIATVVMGMMKWAVGAGLYLTKNPDTVDLALQLSAVLTVVGLAAYAFMEPDRVRVFLGRRQARYGGNVLLMTLAFIGVIFFANSIVYNASTPIKADLTEDKQNTLSPEMVRALDSLPSKLTATAFYSPQIGRASCRERV